MYGLHLVAVAIYQMQVYRASIKEEAVGINIAKLFGTIKSDVKVLSVEYYNFFI